MILWGFTPSECGPYLKHCEREILFREAVLAFLGADNGESGKGKKTNQSVGEFCKGKDLNECLKYFGHGLTQICATCPQ